LFVLGSKGLNLDSKKGLATGAVGKKKKQKKREAEERGMNRKHWNHSEEKSATKKSASPNDRKRGKKPTRQLGGKGKRPAQEKKF